MVFLLNDFSYGNRSGAHIQSQRDKVYIVRRVGASNAVLDGSTTQAKGIGRRSLLYYPYKDIIPSAALYYQKVYHKDRVRAQ